MEAGDILAEMIDQDPNYSARLGQQFEFASVEVKAAKDVVSFYDQQLVYLEDAREQAISSATFALNVAIEKVRAEESDLEAVEADLEQKRLDRERKINLWTEKLVSELDLQKAEADYLGAKAKLDKARALVEQARNDEKAKMAQVNEVAAAQRAKIESTKSLREDARAKIALSERKLTEAETRVERQKTQVVVAVRSGNILRVHAANSADLLAQGAPLIDLVPDTDRMAVELWVRGVDGPLVTPGRRVRLQFEGWPAAQVVGWPSVAVGTFGGLVQVVDSQTRPDGRLRVLVVQDPDDAPWPDQAYLRQGGRANGWVLLDEVSLGFEIWRQLNAFPPSVEQQPDGADSKGKSTKQAKFKDEDKSS